MFLFRSHFQVDNSFDLLHKHFASRPPIPPNNHISKICISVQISAAGILHTTSHFQQWDFTSNYIYTFRCGQTRSWPCFPPITRITTRTREASPKNTRRKSPIHTWTLRQGDNCYGDICPWNICPNDKYHHFKSIVYVSAAENGTVQCTEGL